MVSFAPSIEGVAPIEEADWRKVLISVALEEKVRILTGATSWTLHPLPAMGLESIVCSDGPIGVRGIEQNPTFAAQLPSPSAVAATWSPDLAGRLGSLIAEEARRKGIDVVLAPVVNLQRTPVGGRHFECFSEDPYLTGRIATAYVGATQAAGVGMSVKHFLGNESETDRTTYLARVNERVIREVYLAPFEMVVREARVWSVMAAYNSIDDGTAAEPSTEHSHLLLDVLKGEWGFDGVVLSDWLATKNTTESALGGLDLVMPGPGGPWGDALADAVRSGRVPESVVDDKVIRLLRLGQRTGRLGGLHIPWSGDREGHSSVATKAVLREAVARSIVVLNNNGILPLDTDTLRTLSLIGPNAGNPFIQGGGSAFVQAPYVSLPEDALRAALPSVHIEVHRGGLSRAFAPPIDPGIVSTPDGRPGYELQFLDASGTVLGAPTTIHPSEGWNRQIPRGAIRANIRADVRLTRTGRHRVEAGVSGSHTVWFDGIKVSESARFADSNVILDSSANHPHGPSRIFDVREAQTVRIEANLQVVDAEAYGTFVRFELRHDDAVRSIDEEIDEAVEAARSTDIAVVIVGTNEETESEGWDRTSLTLPGRQDELVRRVAEVNAQTIVVVNAGAPVELPWLDNVAAVLWWWLPGQEAGHGLVDALLGQTEPSGRLPWTLPRRLTDSPVPHAIPENGVVDYVEGVDVGYRGWDRLNRQPARPFGFGLGYGSWGEAHLSNSVVNTDKTIDVTVTIRNEGSRLSREVVQLYLECAQPDPERPVRWLVGFESFDGNAGELVSKVVQIPRRQFETWNATTHEWQLPPVSYTLRAGRSSRNFHDGTLSITHLPDGGTIVTQT